MHGKAIDACTMRNSFSPVHLVKKLQQCMVYETGHIQLVNELWRNWWFSTKFSIQILQIFNFNI